MGLLLSIIINRIMLIVASPNIVSSKLGPRMTTLHEETSNVGNQVSTPINDDDEEKSEADYSEYEAYQVTIIFRIKNISLKNEIEQSAVNVSQCVCKLYIRIYLRRDYRVGEDQRLR